jgi:hypothetical protein
MQEMHNNKKNGETYFFSRKLKSSPLAQYWNLNILGPSAEKCEYLSFYDAGATQNNLQEACTNLPVGIDPAQ